MRNRVICLAIASLIGFAGSGSSQAQEVTNLLTNGGFETGTDGSWGGYGSHTREVVRELVGAAIPDDPIEGDYCLHVIVPTAGANFWDAGLQTYFNQVFEAGKHYTLSAFFKSRSGTMRINFKPELTVDPWTGYGEQMITITEEWAEYSVTTPVISTNVSPAQITFHIANSAGEFWMDAVRFYEGDYVPPHIEPKKVASKPNPADGAAVAPLVFETSVYLILDYTPGAGTITHTAYFSDVRTDVESRDAGHSLGSPPWPEMDPEAYYVGFDAPEVPAFARVPLVRGETYYWAVDEFNGTDTYPGDLWSFFVMPEETWGPTPPDGDTLVIMDPNVLLSWHLGNVETGYTVKYPLYYSTSKTAVDNGTTPNVFALTTSKSVGGLSYNTTYYWRADTKLYSKNPPFALHKLIKGKTWSFTTGPRGIGSILFKYYDGINGTVPSDLYNNPNYPDNPTSTWLVYNYEAATEAGAIITDWDDYYGAEMEGWLYVKQSGNYTFWIASDDGSELWLSTDDEQANEVMIASVSGWTDSRNYDGTAGVPGANQRSAPIALTGGMRYYTRAVYKEGSGGDNCAVTWSGPDTGNVRAPVLPGSQLRGFEQLWAHSPNPVNGSADVALNATLSWKAGAYAASVNGHKLYFGADRDPVMNRTVTAITRTDPCYPIAATLDFGETYYWAVDEVNGVNVWPGNLWSFTTINYLVVDDMEKYRTNVPDPNIYERWVDGAGDCKSIPGNNTGALVDIDTLTAVHGGLQAMKLLYDNDGTVDNPCTGAPAARLTYSKAEALVAKLPSGIGPDWTTGGVTKALSLWFYGDTFNSIEPMWVQLTDASNNKAKVLYGKYADEDVNDVNEASWHEWLISLADFTGVNLTNVKAMAIGIGNETGPAGRSGTLYFDDIRLYTPRCILTRRPADYAKVDYAPEGTPGGDCVINGLELEIMTRDWLQSDRNIAPVAPNPAGLMAQYRFENNANDSSGKGNNGTENGGPVYVAGHTGQAVSLDGVDDYVEVAPGVGITGGAPRTIAGWAKANSMTIADWTNVFGLSSTGTTNEHFDIEKRGGQDQYCVHVYGWEQNILPLDLEWHHFAATYDGTTIVWYGDGVPIGTDSTRVLNSAGVVRMGKRADSGGFFPGLVDEVTFWNYVLTENEIASVRGLGTVYVPVASPANVSDLEPALQKKVNFKDYAVLTDKWLDENEWPLP